MSHDEIASELQGLAAALDATAAAAPLREACRHLYHDVREAWRREAQRRVEASGARPWRGEFDRGQYLLAAMVALLDIAQPDAERRQPLPPKMAQRLRACAAGLSPAAATLADVHIEQPTRPAPLKHAAAK